MSDELRIPIAGEMIAAAETNKRERLRQEREAYPIRLEQWRKQIVQELEAAKKTELDSVFVSPPIPGELGEDWDFFRLRALDGKVRTELAKELTQLGYTAKTEPLRGNLVRLVISWR